MKTITKHDRITRCAECKGNLRCEFVRVNIYHADAPHRVCVHCGRVQHLKQSAWKDRMEVNR